MDALKSAPQVPEVYAPTSAALSSAEDPFDRTVEGGLGRQTSGEQLLDIHVHLLCYPAGAEQR